MDTHVETRSLCPDTGRPCGSRPVASDWESLAMLALLQARDVLSAVVDPPAAVVDALRDVRDAVDNYVPY